MNDGVVDENEYKIDEELNVSKEENTETIAEVREIPCKKRRKESKAPSVTKKASNQVTLYKYFTRKSTQTLNTWTYKHAKSLASIRAESTSDFRSKEGSQNCKTS